MFNYKKIRLKIALKYIISNIRFIFSNYSIIPYKKLFYKSFIYLFLCYVKGIVGCFYRYIFYFLYIFYKKGGSDYEKNNKNIVYNYLYFSIIRL